MSDHSQGHNDNWFRHTGDEVLPQHEHAAHVNSAVIGLTLLAVVFGVLLTVIVLSMYYVGYTTRLRAERQEGTASAAEYLVYRDNAQRSLNQFGWADRQAGTVNLPISRAMDEVVAYYNEPGRAGHEKWRGPLKYVSSEGAATGVAMAEQTPDD